MEKKSKKAQESGIMTKMVGMIILLLVLIAILIFVTKPQLLDWIKNQPMFAPPVDTTKELTTDEIKALNYNPVPIAILKIDKRPDTAFKQYFVWVSDGTNYIQTPIYWQVSDQVNGDIKISKSANLLKFDFGTDPTIGYVKNDFFFIDIGQYRAQKDLFNNEGLLLKINNSKYIPGGGTGGLYVGNTKAPAS